MVCLDMYNPQLKESCKYHHSSISSRLFLVLQIPHWRGTSDGHHEFVVVWSAAFDLCAKTRHEVEQHPLGRLFVVHGTEDLNSSTSTAVTGKYIMSTTSGSCMKVVDATIFSMGLMLVLSNPQKLRLLFAVVVK